MNLFFKKDDVFILEDQIFLHKLVHLAQDERVFVIGGSKDVATSQTFNNCKELLFDSASSSYYLQERKPMTMARAAFACAVYPNQSQIFVCGGSINANESTKQCERYIVKDDNWKRLPDLNEAKFSSGLCFFNNGSTLYCFGGLMKSGQNQYLPTDKVEVLSKGQNNWRILNVKIPEPIFDIGSFELPDNEICLFGGFNGEGATNKAYVFKISNNPEGEIKNETSADGSRTVL